MIGMREREISHMATPPESLMHTETDLRGRSGKRGLFKWHHGPSKTTDAIGILNRNQRETLIFRLSPTEPRTCSPAARKSMKECFK